MNISKIAVNKPVTFLIIFVLIIGLGIYASLDLAIDLYPEINPPVLFIFTNYEGTGPEEIEKTITRPLESALSNVSNINKLTSTSSEGVSQILMEFTWGTDMSEAANEVRDKLEFIKENLPDESESPMIFKFDPSMIPIMYLAVRGNRAPEELRKIGEDIIQPRLEQVEGVAMAGISGGRERIIRVEIPQNRLEAYNLTLTQVSSMLIGQNVQISAGNIEEGNKNFLIRTSGEYNSIDEIKNTVIAYRGGSRDGQGNVNKDVVVRLRDIANVYDGLKDVEDLVFVNGLPSVYISIQKQSGTNSVKTADNVYKRLKKLENEIPQNVSIEVIYDSTKIIRKSLSEVGTTAISGAILAVIILFLFLRSIKSVLIIALSIPISIIVTMLLMYFFGFTLNVMTLAGLALGVGMLVDNSIVILENIYRYREKGAKLTASAILGSIEMMTAIMASTLTTICVFAPLAMFKTKLGMYGELFSGLAFTVVFSLSASLFVAIFLVPVLSSKYLPMSSQLERNLTGITKKVDDYLYNFWIKVDNSYKKALKFVLKRRLLTIITIFSLFLITLIFIKVVGFELIPESEDDFVQLKVELPVGTKLDITKNITEQFEQIINNEIKGYKDIITQAGEKSFHGFLGAPQSHKGTILITLEDEQSKQKETSSEIKSKLRKHFNDFPSVVFSFESRRMGGSASPIDILVKSNDLKKAMEVANKIKDILKTKVPEVTEPNIDLKEGLPQVEIFIDRDKAYSLGLTINSIGREIRANIDGIISSKFREEANEYDILVILDSKDRDAIPDIDKIFVTNSSGNKIPLSSIAYRDKTTGPISINRENQMRTIHVSGGLEKKIKIDGKNKKVKLNEVEMKIRNLINSEIPQDVDLIIDFSGDYADFLKYGLQLIIILLISIALVFGIMASQFESLLDPFIILFTIPLSLIGVILIYFITGEQLSLLAIVGLIVLAGVVVNNGIILVDYTNLLVKRGLKLIDACIEAGGNRLRPILMTTLTTILGLLPMSFTKTEGSDLSRAIGKTILGGLTVSTLFTLFLIPVIYSIFNQFSEKLKIKKQEKRQQQLEIRKQKLSNR